jgi:dolichyl-diphosphooligosaccharide--protein glycosyltransferase
MIAPLAGVGLVYLLAAIDIARPVAIMGQSATSDSQSPRAQRADTTATEERLTSLRLPDGTRVRGYLVVTILVVLLFNLLLVPSFVGQTTHDRAQFDAALTVDAHAEDVDREYPQNFVLSQWGDNRMYNYFVSGESQGYGYAQSNHDRFLVSPHPDDWYDQFQGRVGYVVVTERDGAPPNTTYAVLYEGLGLGVNGTAAVGHYQLLASDDGVRTFTVVPGAKLRITNASSESVTATSTVTIDGTDYEYVRTTAVNDGTATVRVAYPGAYRVGGHTVTVSGQDVLVGNQTTVPPP